ELDVLLTLQEHDSTLERLLHRHHTLPERDALREAEAAAAVIDARLVTTRAERDKVAREEQQLDDEARSLADKAKEVESRMYSGEISSPKELQAMQADVEQLRKHQGTIENRELELMELREPLDATVADFEQQRATLGVDVDGHAAALGAAEAEIIAEMQVERAARDETAGSIDAALVKEYERCRTLAKGAGVARLVGTTCQGCHLSIPAVEAEQIKRTGGQPLAHCDNCGAILVP
ncbi:MAG TPA: C4-type zinc ribbon domain-containing protein, partial [Acidimicrobiia bacterium]